MPQMTEVPKLDPAWIEELYRHHGDDGDSELNPFLWVVIRMLRDFARRSQVSNFAVRGDFQHAMWILVHVGVPVVSLAEQFSTTEHVVERWINGRSSPALAMRPHVIAEGLNFLMQDGLKMAGNVYDPITGELRVSH